MRNQYLNRTPVRTATVMALGLAAMLLLAGCGHETEPTADKAAPAGAGNDIVLSDRQVAELNITPFIVSREVLRFQLPVPGIVMPAPDHEMVASAPVDGRIARLYVREGDRVQAGDPLLEIESLTIGNLVADYIQARADALYMREKVARLETLQARGVGSMNDLQRTKADAQRSEAGFSAARSRLAAIGFPVDELEGLEAGAAIDPRLVVRAGIDGIVSTARVAPGAAVDVHEQLCVLVDPSHVLVRAFLAPQDLPLVRADGQVTAYRDGRLEGPAVSGPVANINPTLDDLNRAATVNAILATENGWPVPGQNLRVQVDAATPGPVLAVPLGAVVFEGESAVVYVALAENRYEKRRVEIERMNADTAIIAAGLTPGERVAATEVFALKALGRIDQFGEE